MEFINRIKEIEAINDLIDRGGLGVIYGRRRLGKTAILKRICADLSVSWGYNTQAVSCCTATDSD